MCLKSAKSVSTIYWLIFLLLAESNSGEKSRIENSLCKELCLPNKNLSADACHYYYSCTLLRELDDTCGSQLSIHFRPKVSDSFSELILAQTSCKNGLICQKSICKSNEVLESKRKLNSEFHGRSKRENVREKYIECDETEENYDTSREEERILNYRNFRILREKYRINDMDYLHLEEDTTMIEDENYDYLGQPSTDQIDGIDDEDLENRIAELDKVQITFEPAATNSPVIFRPKKAVLDDRSFDNVKRRKADKKVKYRSFKFDFKDKKLSQTAARDIYLLTDATESLSGVLFCTQLPERQKNNKTVLIEEKNEYLDDDFENVVCVQLNGIRYKLVYKKNMLDELNLLLSVVKMRSAGNHNVEDEYMSPESAKILYDLFKYYLEQKSLSEKLGMQSNFMDRPLSENSESYILRKKRENESPVILNSEIKFPAPKIIQDVIKYTKSNNNESRKTLKETEYINSGNASITESNNKNNLEKSDNNTQHNKMTLRILKDFVNDNIAGFKDQLKRIERKLEDIKMCEKERDQNGNIFISSSENVPKIEDTKERNLSLKLSRIIWLINHEKLIQDIVSRNNQKGKKRDDGIETSSTIPGAEVPPRKGSFSEEVSSSNAFHQRKSWRKNSPSAGSNEELVRNERDRETRNQKVLRNLEFLNAKLLKDGAKRMEDSQRYDEMVSDSRNRRQRGITSDPEESFFYLENLKEVPRKRDSQHFSDQKKNISDPLNKPQASWPIHSNATSWKMFIAKKDPDFPRRVQLQRTKSSPAGLIQPLNQEETPGYRRKRREVNRMPSLPDYLDYHQGQGYATLGGNLSRSDQSRLLNDLTLNEPHSAPVYQLDNRNNYSSRIEDNGEYLLSTFRSPLKENLENVSTIQINERHHESKQ